MTRPEESSSQEHPQPSDTPTTRPPRPQLTMLAMGAAAGVVVGTALGAGAALSISGQGIEVLTSGSVDFDEVLEDAEVESSVFEVALEGCDLVDGPYSSVVDDGDGLILDHRGEDDLGGLAYWDVECVLEQLDMPQTVLAEINRTRALDGRQTAQWGDYSANWSYHPDSGLNIVVNRE